MSEARTRLFTERMGEMEGRGWMRERERERERQFVIVCKEP